MRIIKIPYPKSEWSGWANDTTKILPVVKSREIKCWFEEQGLTDGEDFDCNYHSGVEEIHVRFYGKGENLVSMFALKYM